MVLLLQQWLRTLSGKQSISFPAINACTAAPPPGNIWLPPSFPKLGKCQAIIAKIFSQQVRYVIF